MTIEFREITKDNWAACVRLKVREDQKGFVAANAVSLVQSHYEPGWQPYAVYAGETMVGFVMYSAVKDPEWGYWILRVMIDEAHQGKGYGRAAMVEILRRLQARPDSDEVFISYQPQNTAAERLYLSLGFEKTGRVVDGELVLRLGLPRKEGAAAASGDVPGGAAGEASPGTARKGGCR